jgi:hypothetical protein
MKTTSIFTCPQCGAQIELNEALTSQIEQSIRSELEAVADQREKEYQQKLLEIQKQQRDLDAKQQSIDQQVDEKLKVERKVIAEQERKKILSEQTEKEKVLEEELATKRKQLSEANNRELELLKEKQKLEEEKESLDLTVQRKMDEERKHILDKAKKQAVEEQLLKLREKEDLIKTMQGQIEVLKRKAETGSQEAQGEALEGALQEVLEQAFPLDRFEEIKKGQRGADILQTVRNNTGKKCGQILWESKYTKDFQKSWIDKIKKDQMDAGTEVAVITSVTLPKEINHFGPYEEIWVTDFQSAVGLAWALRSGLINVAREKRLTSNQDTLKDVIFNYITGNEFVMHVKAVVNAYKTMKDDLETEKRSMIRIWNKRDKQINAVLGNVTQMYGSIEGLLGHKSLPEIEVLSLDNIAEKEES